MLGACLEHHMRCKCQERKGQGPVASGWAREDGLKRGDDDDGEEFLSLVPMEPLGGGAEGQ